MKIILNFLIFFFLFGCGQSAEDISARNEASRELTKGILTLAIATAGCSLLDSSTASAACMESALEDTDGNTKPSKGKSQNNSKKRQSTSSERSCFSDINCGIGSACIKKPNYSRGICMKKVDQYGRQDLTRDEQSRVGVRVGEGQCNYLTDCPIGFKCDRTHKVCVKD